MKPPIIEINDFKGGMTLNEKLGRTDQFHIGYLLDFSSKPGYLAPGIGWTENLVGGSNPTTEFRGIIQTIKDSNVWYGGEDKKLYTGLWSLTEQATSDQAGAIRGLIEYKNYLYYPQDTTIGRKDLSVAANLGFTHNWQTSLTNASEHPMKVSADGKLYFGHGSYLASYDDSTFQLNVLDLADKWVIQCLEDFGYLYLAIGASYTDGNYYIASKIFLWDRISSSWVDEIVIPEDRICAMKFYNGYLWIWAGSSANLYVVPEGSRRATKIWSFVKEAGDVTLTVFPNAVVGRKGTIFFGLSEDSTMGTSTSYPQNPTGIYSFPAEPEKLTLNIVYKGQGYYERFKSLYLIRSSGGGESLISSRYWHSLITSYYSVIRQYNRGNNEYLYANQATYESFRFEAPKNKKIFTEAFGIQYEPFVAGSGYISFYYKKDNDTDYTSLVTIQGSGDANTYEKIIYKRISADSLMFKVELGGSGSSDIRPFLKSIYVTGHLISKV